MSRFDSWRLRVLHETSFEYDGLARASYNELRLTPRTELRQTALESRVVTAPLAPQYTYVDYWGTHVVAFNVDRGHERPERSPAPRSSSTQRAADPADASWTMSRTSCYDHDGRRIICRTISIRRRV